MLNKIWLKSLVFCFLVYFTQANAEGINFGINLQFVEPQSRNFAEDELDVGLGINFGYEFLEYEYLNLGAQYEYFHGWNDEDEMDEAGEFMYDSHSILAIARIKGLPVIFKAGLVKADYKVLLFDGTRLYRNVDNTGRVLGFSLAWVGKGGRLELLDYKNIKVGNDYFESLGISFAIFLH